jgi:hypothetical protein
MMEMKDKVVIMTIKRNIIISIFGRVGENNEDL